MKKIALGQRIDGLIRAGWDSAEIAAHLQCRVGYVYEIKASGGWEARCKTDRERSRKRYGHQPRDVAYDEIHRRALVKNSPVIADVLNGATYRQAAEKYGLKSRNCVAGIMSRYRDRYAGGLR